MPILSSAQIRAARALLGWSRTDLASKAVVSFSTVRRFEEGHTECVSPRMGLMIRVTLEEHGVTFLADDGSGPGVRVLQRQLGA